MLLDSLHTTKFLHQSGQLTMSLITLTATDELSYETSFLYQGKENLVKKKSKEGTSVLPSQCLSLFHDHLKNSSHNNLSSELASGMAAQIFFRITFNLNTTKTPTLLACVRLFCCSHSPLNSWQWHGLQDLWHAYVIFLPVTSGTSVYSLIQRTFVESAQNFTLEKSEGWSKA